MKKMFNEEKYKELKREVKRDNPNASPYEVCNGAMMLAELRGIELQEKPKPTEAEVDYAEKLNRQNQIYNACYAKVESEHPELSPLERIERAMMLAEDPNYSTAPAVIKKQEKITLEEAQKNCSCRRLTLSEVKKSIAAKDPRWSLDEINFCSMCRRNLN